MSPAAVGGRLLMAALLATLASGVPMTILLDIPLHSEGAKMSMLLALLGNVVFGLPLALAAFLGLRKRADLGAPQVFAAANAAAFGLIIVVVLLTGSFGLVFLGLPIWIAANVFALAGWLLLVRPPKTIT